MTEIIWTQDAEQHVSEIKAYIAKEDSPERALSVVEKIMGAPEILRYNPNLGSFVKGFKRKRLKEIYIFKWRILFTVSKDKQTVKIQAVWHGARRLRKEDIGEIET